MSQYASLIMWKGLRARAVVGSNTQSHDSPISQASHRSHVQNPSRHVEEIMGTMGSLGVMGGMRGMGTGYLFVGIGAEESFSLTQLPQSKKTKNIFLSSKLKSLFFS